MDTCRLCRAPTKPFCDGLNTGRSPPAIGTLTQYATTFDGQRWRERHRRSDVPTWTPAACAEPPTKPSSPHEAILRWNEHQPAAPGLGTLARLRHHFLTDGGNAVGTGGAIFPPTWKPAACAEPPAKVMRTSTSNVALSLAAHPNSYPGVHISISARHRSPRAVAIWLPSPGQFLARQGIAARHPAEPPRGILMKSRRSQPEPRSCSASKRLEPSFKGGGLFMLAKRNRVRGARQHCRPAPFAGAVTELLAECSAEICC